MNEANQKRAHRVLAVTLAITALGMFIADVSRDDPMTPPGIYVLGLVALILYYTSRWAWTAAIGLLVALAILNDVLTTPGVAYHFQHPEFRGQLIGTLIKLAGLIASLVTGVAVIVIRIQLAAKTSKY